MKDSNGRAVWVLGFVISLDELLPQSILLTAKWILGKAQLRLHEIHSTRAMAFAIKGLYFSFAATNSPEHIALIKLFADRLVQMYKHESTDKWDWFEGYLTYANSVLPEALLYAWLLTGQKIYKDIAVSSFKFLLEQTFNQNGIEVIPNKNWIKKGETPGHFVEQPIDVAYTIMTLSIFYDAFCKTEFRLKLEIAFNWFLGYNRLHQIIYNPCS